MTANPGGASLAGRRVIVMGLGRFGGGIGVARWLTDQGARVVVTDAVVESQLTDSIEKLGDLPIDYRLGGHDPRILDDADLLIVSPAVAKERSSFFQAATRRGIDWTTEINLFLERCPARVVGVTGTAGKSTTVAMVHSVLRGATPARKAYLGGNIGGSLLGETRRMSPDDVVVLELSSFQLADLPRITRRPDLAVIVNVWPHHLDRHRTFEAYLGAKLNMIRGAAPGTPLVIGFDEPHPLSKVAQVADTYGVRLLRASDYAVPAHLGVPGEHNRLNARCAATVCAELDIDDNAIRDGLERFGGLPHRLQLVARLGGIEYYNDSKSTSPRSAASALRSFDRPVIALLGGKAGTTPDDELIDTIVRRVKAAVCFGAVGATLYDALARRARGAVVLRRAERLADAFALARCEAREGDVVVLSPGFESYDAFANYEQRGDAFTSLVRAAPGDNT